MAILFFVSVKDTIAQDHLTYGGSQRVTEMRETYLEQNHSSKQMRNIYCSCRWTSSRARED